MSTTTINVPELARRLGVSEAGLYYAAAKGKLRAQKVGGRWLIPATEAERYTAAWKANEHGMAAHWRRYRAWRDGQEAVAQPVAS